jgi:hypothetical protein
MIQITQMGIQNGLTKETALTLADLIYQGLLERAEEEGINLEEINPGLFSGEPGQAGGMPPGGVPPGGVPPPGNVPPIGGAGGRPPRMLGGA